MINTPNKNFKQNYKLFPKDYEEIARRELTSEKKYRILNQTPSKNSNSNFSSNEKVFYSTPIKSSSLGNIISFNKSESKYYNSTQKVKKITAITDDDKTACNNIDEILNLFINNFSYHSSDYILDCLKRNSFNLQDSYLQLCKPNEFEGILF